MPNAAAAKLQRENRTFLFADLDFRVIERKQTSVIILCLPTKNESLAFEI